MSKQKKKNENINFKYMNLLSDNSPKVSEEYREEAAILNEQISNPSVFNVAIMAKYGAGKSSAINTYLNMYRSDDIKSEDKIKKLETQTNSKNTGNIKENQLLGDPAKNRYTKISLSTFNNTNYNEIAIERSILQQLLYCRKKSKLPNSKIERTNKNSVIKVIFFSLLISLFILAVVLTITEFSLFARAIDTAGITSIFCGVGWVKYFLLGLSTVLLFAVICLLVYYKKLKKIKYKDLEADFVDKDSNGNSIQVANLINKFIDEVLYFFECIDIDLVIFEDLDRLSTTEIFVKLRELNTIINNSNKKAKKVTFLYAIKNSIFDDQEERAKFFDFILPIVPIINPVTALTIIDKKVQALSSVNSDIELAPELLKRISLYITDMRILNNTFNDFVIMYSKIFESDNANKYLDQNKLFALSVYKNLFPEDYMLMEKYEGLIPKVINLKSLRSRLIKDIEEDIAKTEFELEKRKEEKLKTFEELKTMLNGQLSKYEHINRGITPQDVFAIKTFEGLKFENLMHPTYKGYCADVRDEILTPSGDRYIDREKRIKEIAECKIDVLQQKLSDLEKQKQEINFWTIKDIVKCKGVEFCISEKDLLDEDKDEDKIEERVQKEQEKQVQQEKEKIKKQKELQVRFLSFLLSYDYIDEHYIEYTSNFKAEKLSFSDVKVVQAIQSGQHNFNVELQNITEVVRWLEEDDFERVSVLINPILSGLSAIETISQEDKNYKYKNLINLLSKENIQIVQNTIIEFVCISTDETFEEFFRHLISKRVILCDEILLSDKVSVKRKDCAIACFIKYAKDYKKLNNIIADYIHSNENYLNIFDGINDDKKVIKFIKEQSIEVEKLSCDKLNEDIQKYIIENNMYDISIENLAVVLFGGDKPSSEFYTQNYDTILSSEKDYLIELINNNINYYVDKVLLSDKITCENESKEAISKLLLNSEIHISSRIELIKKYVVKFEDISVFDAGLYQTMFDYNAVEPIWKNVQIAFEKSGFDVVKEFLRRTQRIGGDYVSLEGIQKDTVVNITNAILINLSKDEISILEKTMPVIMPLSLLNIDKIGDDNLSEFIFGKRVKYDNTDLAILFEYSQSLNEYVHLYKDKILEQFDAFFELALPVESYERRLVNGAYRNVSIYNAKLNSQKIIATILSCEDIDISIKKQLIDKCTDIINIKGYEHIYAHYIISKNQCMSPNILWQFSDSNILSSDKLKILVICNYGGENSTAQDIKNYLISMGAPYDKLFGDLTKVNITKTMENAHHLYKLKEKGVIKDYNKARGKEEYVIVP